MRLPFAGVLMTALFVPTAHAGEPGTFVSALWLTHRAGTIEALSPARDEHLKARLSGALKDATLTAPEVEGLMDPAAFRRLAGPEGRLDAAGIARAAATDLPPSRARLNPALRAHADLLTTSFDRIDEPHREPLTALADWLVANHRPGRPLQVSVICTGNSRRSMLGATMGNVAAAYYGMPEVRFHSGGTAPTAFNPRTIDALRAVGVEVEPTGAEAPRGEPGTPNPVYRVRWGGPGKAGEPEMEALDFSKVYSDPANPKSDFAALMVCGEADAACPVVRGASVRIAMPYLDPKAYDGSPFEAAKYAERRDDIGRLMLSAFMQARNRLAAGSP